MAYKTVQLKHHFQSVNLAEVSQSLAFHTTKNIFLETQPKTSPLHSSLQFIPAISNKNNVRLSIIWACIWKK